MSSEIIKEKFDKYENGEIAIEALLDRACGVRNDESSILLVDSNVFNMTAIQGLLSQFNLNCDKAISGISAE